jgi:hypothetical protein
MAGEAKAKDFSLRPIWVLNTFIPKRENMFAVGGVGLVLERTDYCSL